MKYKIQLTLAALFLVSTVAGQSLVLTYEGQTLAPNAGITKEGLASEYEIVAYLDVTNTSSNDIAVRVQRYEKYMVPGTQSAICWLLCFTPDISLSPYAITIAGGETNTTDFAAHYYPDGNAGISEIAFVFFDDDNPEDSVMVTIYFNGLITGTGQIHQQSISRIYPNPASDFFTLETNYDLSGDLRVEILSITGSVVSISPVSQEMTRVNTRNLHEGMYFYRLVLSGEVVETGRFIIRH
jgi:hypothetical protein